MDAGVVDAGSPDAGCVCASPRYCDASDRCVADTTPPRVTVTAGAGTSTATLHVSGTATDAETGVSAVEVRLNASGAVTVPVANGLFDAQIPVPSGARYEFRVEAKARDAAGNEATAQTVFDTLAPELTITPNQAGACSVTGCVGAFIDANTTSFTVTANVTESGGLASSSPVQVRVSTAGGSVVVPWTDLTASNGAWSWTWTGLPALDFTQMLVEVTATDASANRATASVSLLFDRVRPALSFSPAQDAACTASGCTGAVVTAATTSLDLLGITSADAAVSLRILDGASVVAAPVDVAVTSGSWTWSWAAFPQVDGRFYSVEVSATDALRNSSSRTLVVLVDRVLPSMLINAPRQGTLVGASTVQVNTSASDGHGLQRVEAATSAAGPWVAAMPDVNGDFVASLPVPVVDAVEQTLTVRAVDLVGNTRTSTTRYTADRVAPQLTIAGTDYDCSGAVCVGSVANRTASQVTYSGTASDASPVTIRKTLVGGNQILAMSNDPLTFSSWSWTWATLPGFVNGASYELRVVATDAAGNSSAQVVRKTWLDNVAPVLTIPVAGATTVGVSDVLVAASEPMNVASVQAAVSLSPPVSMTSIGSTDSRNFSFSGGGLTPYTPYALSVGVAQDKAGNPSTFSPTGTFTTRVATFPNPRTVLSPPTDGSAYRLPLVVVDADGRATIAYSRDNGSWVEAHTRHDTGTGTVSSLGPLFVVTNVLSPTSLRLTDSSRQPDGRLLTTSEVGFVATYGTNSSLAYASLTSTPTSTSEMNAFSAFTTIGPTRSVPRTELGVLRPALEQVRGNNVFTGQPQTVRTFVSPNVGATAMVSWLGDSSGWSQSSPAAMTGFIGQDGRATVELPSGALGPNRVRFWDLDQKSEVFSGGFIRAATAPPTLKSFGPFGLVATTASYVAWSTETALKVACSAAPFAATPTWNASTVTVPTFSMGGRLTSAMTQNLVVVAGEFGGNVLVYSAPQVTNCSAPPALTQVGVITGAKEPGVFIDAAGRIWVVTVTNSNGVMLHQF